MVNKKLCKHCNKPFIITHGHNNQKFCSKSCAMKFRHPDDIGLFDREDISDRIKNYILGLIITDGCIRKTGESKTICISLKDEDMIIKIHDLVCPNRKYYKDGDNFQVIWKNANDIKYLTSLDITEHKTDFVPFIDLSDYMGDFIRGIFDGDGCVYTSTTHDYHINKDYNYTYISFTTGSPNFLIGLTNYLNKQNIEYNVIRDNRHKFTYNVHITKKASVKSLYDLMYKDINDWKLNRKYNKFGDLS